MESQRVKCITEGYLRGWLSFDYRLKTSHFREELILDYIESERLYGLMQNKAILEAVMRSSVPNKNRDIYDGVYDLNRAMIGLKLPSALPKDRIAVKKISEATKEDFAAWKEELAKAKLDVAKRKANANR